MKQLFVLFLLSLCSVAASAQDVIVKKDGSTIVCRIVDVGSTVVVYKKWTDLKGDSQMINLADISAINYESGKKENYSEVSNDYKPYNQNDGMHKFNDNALINIDTEMRNPLKKAKNLRLAGIISGAVLAGVGIYALASASDYNFFDMDPKDANVVGAIFIGCGAISATTLCLIANHYQKKYKQLQASSVFQQDFKFKNGTVLTPSIDMYDMSRNSRGLGVGLSYKF